MLATGLPLFFPVLLPPPDVVRFLTSRPLQVFEGGRSGSKGVAAGQGRTVIESNKREKKIEWMRELEGV